MLYYRDKLLRVEKAGYDQLLDGLSSMEREIPLGSDIMTSEVMRVWKLVLADNPSLFHVLPKFSVHSIGSEIVAVPEYSMSSKQISEHWARVERCLSEYKSLLRSSDSEYDKVLRAYEYIIRLCEYGSSENDQNMCSVFSDHISCCAGYSAAFKYLLDQVGIDCLYAYGYVDGKKKTGSHAWNAVKVDGKWSWVDVTWGDPVKEGKDLDEVSYNYLCLSDKYMSRTHDPDRETRKMLPKCRDDSNDWFVRNHMFFDVYDFESVKSAVQGDVLKREIGFGKDDKGECSMKFSSHTLKERAKADFWSDMKIVDVLREVYGAYDLYPIDFSFSDDDEIDTFTIRYRILRKGA